MNSYSQAGRAREEGASLIIAILLLFVVTILALAGARNTLLQERMAGNMVDRNMAFQAAEGGLSEAERRLRGGAFNAAISEQAQPSNAGAWVTFFADSGNADAIFDFDLNLDSDDIKYELSGNPRFVIEELPQAPNLVADQPPLPSLFRITVIGQGGTPNSVVILQSAYRL